jgi:hypothetical protein
MLYLRRSYIILSALVLAATSCHSIQFESWQISKFTLKNILTATLLIKEVGCLVYSLNGKLTHDA